jgi:hypothetical protein
MVLGSSMPFAAVLLLSAIGWCLLMLIEIRRQQNFRQAFPPISDTEFLVRCRPGVDSEIAIKVRRIVANRLGVEYERIHPSSRFAEDLGTD